MCYGVQPVGGEFLQKKAMVFSEARAVAAGCARMCGSYAPAQQTAAALLVFSDTTRPLGTNSCPHAFLRASYSYRRPRAECILPPVKLDLSVEVTDRGERGGAFSSSSVCWYVCCEQPTPAGDSSPLLGSSTSKWRLPCNSPTTNHQLLLTHLCPPSMNHQKPPHLL